MPATGQPAARRVAAVERAVRVLDALAEAGGELGVNEIARRGGMNPSTASRLLATLAATGLVERVDASGRYRLGLRLARLGHIALARLDLRESARPHLEALVAETGETATLSVPGDPDAITVDFVQSPSSVQSVARVGRPSVAHATAVGKVALAFGRQPLPRPPLRAFTSRTITDPARLAQEVAEVKARGWAQATGEREDDLNAVAAPVRGPSGELIAILGVQGPASRFHRDSMQAAVAILLDRARALSAALGSPA
ncbi:MAG: IclR family transcriptional regulator [Thermoleophilia bacterium]